MDVTVKWRETSERTSVIAVDPGYDHDQIAARVMEHVQRMAAAARAERIEAVHWTTDEPAARFGGTFG